MQIEQKQNKIFKPQSIYTLAAEESNQVTTELENQIRAGGLTPSASSLTQLRDSIQNVVDTAANDLQEQIDAITVSSDVFDVVGTYADLQNYDTSTVPLNDIIKVLQDSTHNNAATYYRLVETSGGVEWQYVGQEGPFYTKSEADAYFALKSEVPTIATTSQVGLVKPDGETVVVQNDGTLVINPFVSAALPLFTQLYADHLLNDVSYLRANTFSWQSGNVYVAAYNELLSQYNNAASTTESETISGTTVTYKLTPKGYKIAVASQENNVAQIFSEVGTAWYYILDTDNTRFKLPRGEHGNIVEKKQSGTQWYRVYSDGWCEQGGIYDKGSEATMFSATLSLLKPFIDSNYFVSAIAGGMAGNKYGEYGVNAENKTTSSFDIYYYTGSSADGSRYITWEAKGFLPSYPENSQYKYLYLYCGNFEHSAVEQTAGLNAELFNGKVDLNLNNIDNSNNTAANNLNTKGIRTVIEAYSNGTNWYRVWSDGWCEQGGKTYCAASQWTTINFLKVFADTNYEVTTGSQMSADSDNPAAKITNFTTTSFSAAFKWDTGQYKAGTCHWVAYGYIS